MRNPLSQLAGLIVAATLATTVSAEVITKTIKVSPGDLGSTWITDSANKGDKLVVKFEAAEGFILVEAKCNDSNKLGWTPAGNFTFELVLEKDFKTNTTHKTAFDGTVKAKPKEGAKGGGKEDPKLLPWNINGMFTVLGDHEGVDHDLGRDPETGLVTSKPNTDPAFKGEAKYNPDTKMFEGTFVSQDPDDPGAFTGQYSSIPARVDPATINPQQLGDVEQKNCPETGCNEKVFFANYGCSKGEKGFGGMADPDTITINTFTVEPELGNLETEIKQLEKDIVAKKAELAKAEKDRDGITAEIAKMEAQIQAAIAEKIKNMIRDAERNVELAKQGVKKAEEDLATAEAKLAEERKEKSETLNQLNNQLNQKQKELAQAQKDLAAATKQSEINKLKSLINSLTKAIENLVKDIVREEQSIEKKLRTYIAKVETAKQMLVKAQELLTRREKELADIKAKAEAEARKDPRIAKMIQLQDAKKEELKKAEELIAKLKKEIEEAEKKLEAANERAEFLRHLQKSWDDSVPSLISHEKEHRIICYFYADKLTDMANKLRAWGYSPNEIRAQNIGKQHFRIVYQEMVYAIMEKDEATQRLFDKLTGHGLEPDKWNRDEHLK